jgi:hypothetical protein
MPSTVLQPATEPRTPISTNIAKIVLNMMFPIQHSSEPDHTACGGATLFVPLKTQGQVETRCKQASATQSLPAQGLFLAPILPFD